MSRCEGLHCPGCGHDGGRVVLGALAVAVAAVIVCEVIMALLWVIVVTAAAAAVAGVAAVAVIARRMNAPVELTRYRPAGQLGHGNPAGLSGAADSAAYAQLESRLRDAEINARAALLAAGIVAQRAVPQPLSGPHSTAERR